MRLTMNVYTDPRLLDIAGAVDVLPMLSIDATSAPVAISILKATGTESGRSSVAPMVAPDTVHNGQIGSIPDHFDGSTASGVETKKPRNPLRITGFSLIGPAGFEPTTSTTPTNKRGVKSSAKHWAKCDGAERLHQCLHQIAELVERGGLENLAEAIADSLEPDVLQRLADALNKRAERIVT